jgi:hypothetical protein
MPAGNNKGRFLQADESSVRKNNRCKKIVEKEICSKKNSIFGKLIT